MGRHMSFVGCSMVVMALLIGATQATKYKVGDSFGWNIPTNQSFYSEWARSKNFSVGDELVFNWTGDHTLGFASKDEYDNCNIVVTNLLGSTEGGSNRTVWTHTLVQTGPHYFICNVSNHCAIGQKFSINVSSTSALTLSHLGLLSPFVSTLALYFFTRI